MAAIVQTDSHILGGILLQEGHVYVTVAFSKEHFNRIEEMEETLYVLNEGDTIVEHFLINQLGGIYLDNNTFNYEMLEFPKEEDKERLEEELPGIEYIYLVKDKNDHHYFASHVGPCEPRPYFYIEDPSNVESVFRDIYELETVV